MWTQIRAAAIVTAFLAGTAVAAHAQTTLDSRGTTAGSSTTNRLGPSTPSPVTGGNGTLGAGDMSNGNWSGNAPSTGDNPAGTMGYGKSPSSVGAGSSAGPAGSATGNGPTGAGGTSAIGGGR